MRGRVFRDFFDHLVEGDAIALTIAAVIVFIIVAFTLITLKVRQNLKREDEAHAKRYGRKPLQ